MDFLKEIKDYFGETPFLVILVIVLFFVALRYVGSVTNTLLPIFSRKRKLEEKILELQLEKLRRELNLVSNDHTSSEHSQVRELEKLVDEHEEESRLETLIKSSPLLLRWLYLILGWAVQTVIVSIFVTMFFYFLVQLIISLTTSNSEESDLVIFFVILIAIFGWLSFKILIEKDDTQEALAKYEIRYTKNRGMYVELIRKVALLIVSLFFTIWATFTF